MTTSLSDRFQSRPPTIEDAVAVTQLINAKVNLSVDSKDATGAPRFYEHAGMHVATFMDTYEKPLTWGEHT